MSFSEEKMMILNMLQDGKITAEEAARLLEAIGDTTKSSANDNTQKKKQKTSANYQEEIAKLRERINEWRTEFSKNHKAEDFEKFIDDFTSKAEKAGKSLASATYGAVDKIVDFVSSAVDTGSFSFFSSYTAVERLFEADAAEGTDIEIEASNGPIIIKKNPENKVTIKTTVRSPQSDPDKVVKFQTMPELISMKLADAERSSVSHEILLPEVKFGKIRLVTKNGRINVEDSKSSEFESITKNASIELAGANCDKISLDTKNAKITLNYVTADTIDIGTENAFIDMKNIKTSTLNASTANGKITISSIYNIDNEEATSTLKLKTKNGDIKINMNDTESSAYKVKAQATNGGVNLLIPNLIYSSSGLDKSADKKVEAVTDNYDSNPRRFNIDAETLNGYVEIVR